jgi:hypothetical protein
VPVYRSVVATERLQINKLAATGAAGSLQTCYCLDQAHILALRLEDCVYEERFIKFQRFTNVWRLQGLEFTFLKSDKGERFYSVSRVHAKRLYMLQNPAGSRGIIEVRLIKSSSLHLAIAGSDSRFAVRVSLPDGAELIHENVPLESERLGLYVKLDGALVDALAASSHSAATAILQNFVEDVRKEDAEAYSLTHDIIATIVNEKSHSRLRDKIRLYRTRIWDAPVLSREVRRLLEYRLAELSAGGIPPQFAADLARLNMPLEEVEALEHLEGSIRRVASAS